MRSGASSWTSFCASSSAFSWAASSACGATRITLPLRRMSRPLVLQDDVQRLVPGDVLQAQRHAALDRVGHDDVLPAGVGQELQHRPHVDVLEVQRQALARVDLVLCRATAAVARGRWLDLDHVLVVGLVGDLLEVAGRRHDEARAVADAHRVELVTGVAKSTTS